MKSEKILKLIFVFFAVVGIILLIIAVLVFISNNKFASQADEIEGVIETIETYRGSNGDIDHKVYVSYTYNGKEYNNVRIRFYSSNMYEGKDIVLYCDPKNPERVVMKGADLFTFLLLTVMGIIFICVGIIPVSVLIYKRAKKNKVRSTGRSLYATVEEISYNTSYTVNGRHPYVVYCIYRDDYRNITYHFKSENLWVNPEPVLTVGSMIKVYVEESNYNNYYVDTECMIWDKAVDYT